jgi:hypothetical protein
MKPCSSTRTRRQQGALDTIRWASSVLVKARRLAARSGWRCQTCPKCCSPFRVIARFCVNRLYQGHQTQRLNGKSSLHFSHRVHVSTGQFSDPTEYKLMNGTPARAHPRQDAGLHRHAGRQHCRERGSRAFMSGAVCWCAVYAAARA